MVVGSAQTTPRLLQAAGRVLSDPLNLTVRACRGAHAGQSCSLSHARAQVEYTVAMAEDPDPSASFVNCQSSFVLQDAYARDRTLQDELAELERLRVEYERYTKLLAFWEHVLRMRKFNTPPELPPPPPPPPYPALPDTDLRVGPPAPPQLVTPEQQTQQLIDRQDEIALRIAELTELIGTCTPSASTTCGFPANEVRCSTAVGPPAEDAHTFVLFPDGPTGWVLLLYTHPPQTHARRAVSGTPERVSATGTRPVGLTRRQEVPRLRDAQCCGAGLLRVCNDRPACSRSPVRPCTRAAVFGTRSPTPRPPTPRPAGSFWTRVRCAWTKPVPC